MSGSVKQARKGLRPHTGTKSEVIGPQKGNHSKAIGTNVRQTANPRG